MAAMIGIILEYHGDILGVDANVAATCCSAPSLLLHRHICGGARSFGEARRAWRTLLKAGREGTVISSGDRESEEPEHFYLPTRKFRRESWPSRTRFPAPPAHTLGSWLHPPLESLPDPAVESQAHKQSRSDLATPPPHASVARRNNRRRMGITNYVRALAPPCNLSISSAASWEPGIGHEGDEAFGLGLTFLSISSISLDILTARTKHFDFCETGRAFIGRHAMGEVSHR